MAKVLIIDDDKILCGVLSRKIQNIGHESELAHTLKDGMSKALTSPYDVIFLDVRMPDGNGLELLPKIQQTPSSPEVIIITGNGEPDGAELAIKSGAWDYVEKPSSIKAMTLPLVRALQYRSKKKGQTSRVVLKRDGIIGSSQQVTAVLDLVAQAASTLTNVLITGETGTGKELFAKAIHANSARADGPFVVVDCASLTETLAESELFGYQKGAFTGAEKNREGLIRQANGGTLFLDEIGELPLNMQKTFLRVLQERRFRNVGGDKEISSDFRLVAATNQDLAEMVNRGQFRKDLYFRLRTFHIELPPLRMRGGDIKEIAIYYMNRLCEENKIGLKGFSSEFIEALMAFNWPGNIRELVNTMETVFVMARHDSTLYPKHLPADIRIQIAKAQIKGNKVHRRTEAERPAFVLEAAAPGDFPTFRKVRKETMADMERAYLRQLSEVAGGNIQTACKKSGLSRARLYELLKKHSVAILR